MKESSKTAAALLLAALTFCLCGCVRDERFDYSELNVRIGELGERYRMDETKLYFSDDVYYYYYSLTEENDILLTLKEDETKRLERITLTCDETDTAAADDFYALAILLARVFIPGADIAALREETCMDDPAELKAKTICTYASGAYRASLFASGNVRCFMLFYERNKE